ncbi:tetratricopeptide repeat protein [Bacteroidales bacterium OttesenSCG-928-I14]|nr:tetratricopeptide repeat protein [Bacteroidales bacterium OttesenSCG-928-I14]
MKYSKSSIFIICLLFFNNINYIYSINQKNTFDSLSREFDNICLISGNRSKEIIDELYKISYNHNDSLSLIYECLHKEAILSFDQGIVDNTIPERIKYRLTNESNTSYQNALLGYSLGMYLSATGDYSDAFTVTLEALSEFRNLNDSVFIGKNLNLLGTICSHINLVNMSEDYYREALEFYPNKDHDYLRIKNNMARLDMYSNNAEAAADSLIAMIPLAESANDIGILTFIYLNVGSSYFSLKEYDTAYHYWQKASAIFNKFDNSRIEATLNQNMGTYYVLVEEDYDKALDCFRRTKEISEHNNNLVQLSASYKILYQTFDLTSEADSAYFYLKKYQELSQQLVPNAKAIEAYQSYVSTFLEASKKELRIAEQEIELKNQLSIVMIMLLVSLVLIATIFLLLFQQQKKKRERENHELEERLRHEKEIQKIEKERQEIEKEMQMIEKKKQEEVIAAQTREITSYSLLLSNKNNIFNQILELNEQIANDTKTEKEKRSKISEIIKNNLNVDNEWKSFKIHFEKVHPSFFDKLKQHSAELTENNLRICAYFRIGMSTKQIAQILHISPGSVFLNRHRLKKKLGLREEDDLDDFIRTI